jgi:CubicO group peptidase (beta-lactamase class C family)
MLDIIRAGGTRFAPRERVEYNNSNYLLLSYVLEHVYEKPYAAIVQQRIVDKLGLPRTYHGTGTHTADHESASYQLGPGGWVPVAETDPQLHLGAGGLVSNPIDLVRFMDAIYATRLVTAYSVDTLRGANGGPPAALYPYSVAGHTGYGHGGRVEGYRACVYHFPNERLSISYATNASVLSMDEIVDEVLALLFDRKRKPPDFRAVKLSAGDRAALVGSWKSAPGVPAHTPFRQFAPTDQPLELSITNGPDALTASLNGGNFTLVPLGGNEFLVDGLRYFLRAYPDREELVVRGPEWAYYFTRAR